MTRQTDSDLGEFCLQATRTTPNSLPSTRPLRLLELPFEIRTYIYRYLFGNWDLNVSVDVEIEDDGISHLSEGNMFLRAKRRFTTSPPRPWQILACSKQTYTEVKPALDDCFTGNYNVHSTELSPGGLTGNPAQYHDATELDLWNHYFFSHELSIEGRRIDGLMSRIKKIKIISNFAFPAWRFELPTICRNYKNVARIEFIELIGWLDNSSLVSPLYKFDPFERSMMQTDEAEDSLLKLLISLPNHVQVVSTTTYSLADKEITPTPPENLAYRYTGHLVSVYPFGPVLWLSSLAKYQQTC